MGFQHLKRNIRIRKAALEIEDQWNPSLVQSALGISSAAWYAMKSAANPGKTTLSKLSIALAAPVSFLLESDHKVLQNLRVPPDDWLDWYDHSVHDGMDWDEWCEVVGYEIDL